MSAVSVKKVHLEIIRISCEANNSVSVSLYIYSIKGQTFFFLWFAIFLEKGSLGLKMGNF